MVREALKELDLAPEETRASVQGFGHVAQHAIRLYQQIGGKVTCVSCQDPEGRTCNAVRREDGIELDALLRITDGFGSIDLNEARKLGYEVLQGDAWIDQKVDILLPAALENQITGENAERIRPTVKIIAEGANGPTTPEADRILSDRGVYVVPDFLANAGGMICSYFEQVQCNANYFWEKDEVLSKLDVKMTAAFSTVNELALRRKITLRDAAYYIAVDRVARACRERGWV
jgi:glutamate dehydrogenase (NAD(P)+)